MGKRGTCSENVLSPRPASHPCPGPGWPGETVTQKGSGMGGTCQAGPEAAAASLSPAGSPVHFLLSPDHPTPIQVSLPWKDPGACPAILHPLGYPMPCFCCPLSPATWRDVGTYPTFPVSGAPDALIPGDTHPTLPGARCSPQLEVCRLGGVTEVDAHHHAGCVPWCQALWNHRAAITSHVPT